MSEQSLTDAEVSAVRDHYCDRSRKTYDEHASRGAGELLALRAEVRERRAAEQRVRAVLAEWDQTEPEDGWGRMAEEITAALGS